MWMTQRGTFQKHNVTLNVFLFHLNQFQIQSKANIKKHYQSSNKKYMKLITINTKQSDCTTKEKCFDFFLFIF